MNTQEQPPRDPQLERADLTGEALKAKVNELVAKLKETGVSSSELMQIISNRVAELTARNPQAKAYESVQELIGSGAQGANWKMIPGDLPGEDGVIPWLEKLIAERQSR